MILESIDAQRRGLLIDVQCNKKEAITKKLLSFKLVPKTGAFFCHGPKVRNKI